MTDRFNYFPPSLSPIKRRAKQESDSVETISFNAERKLVSPPTSPNRGNRNWKAATTTLSRFNEGVVRGRLEKRSLY